MSFMKSGQPWLYDDTTGDIVGIKDPDGSEQMLTISKINPVTGMVRFPGLVGASAFGPLTQALADTSDIPSSITYPSSPGWGGGAISAEDARFTRWGGLNIAPDKTGGFGQYKSLPSSSFEGAMPFFREFGFDGTTLVIRAGIDAGKQKWFLWVDGKLTSVAGYTATAGVNDVTIVFPSAKPRTITILGCWGEHYITLGAATDTLWKVSRSKGRRAAVITDSWGQGVSDPMTGWAYNTLLALGYSDILPSMQGGTGYYNSGTGGQGRRNFSDRLYDEVLAGKPDDVFIGGSINDLPSVLTGVSRADYKSNVRSVVSRVISSGSRLFGFGTQFVDPTKAAEYTAQDAELASVYQEFSQTILSNNGWLTGNGKIGSTTGDGNRDVYRLAEGNHLADVGSVYWSRRLIAEWANKVRNAEI